MTPGVLVTRPLDDARRTAAGVERMGLRAIIAPVLRIVATGTPRPPGPVDALVVTSAKAVPALLASRRADEAALPTFAVGARSADALRQAGFERIATGTGDGLALARLIAETMPAGSRLLHAAGRDRRPEPESSLRAAGFRITTWETYEARAEERLPPPAAAALRAGSAHAALHFSGRSLSALFDLASKEGLDAQVLALAHVCLSAEVAAALPPGAGRTAIASRPDEASLLATLHALSGTAGPGSPLPQSRW